MSYARARGPPPDVLAVSTATLLQRPAAQLRTLQLRTAQHGRSRLPPTGCMPTHCSTLHMSFRRVHPQVLTCCRLPVSSESSPQKAAFWISYCGCESRLRLLGVSHHWGRQLDDGVAATTWRSG